MRNLINISMCVICIFGLFSCDPMKEESAPGSIDGFVSNLSNGNMVWNANISLTPGGASLRTGSNGYYSFENVTPGIYSLIITKDGFKEKAIDGVEVKSEKSTTVNIHLEQLPLTLRIVDDGRNDISELDFGTEFTTRTFNIFNPGPYRFDWEVNHNCAWISKIEPAKGTLEIEKQHSITITIDPSKLSTGKINRDIVTVSTIDNGSKELVVKAGEETRLPELKTNAASQVTSTSALLSGTITNIGEPEYTERGFVYSTTSAQPTLDSNTGKLIAAKNPQNDFSVEANTLSSYTTYFVRAYATNSVGTAYGNDISFQTGSQQTSVSTSAATDISSSAAILNGSITDEGKPAYTEKGFCYGTNEAPTISHKKVVVQGPGAGKFSVHINELAYKTKYYARAYAIQSGNVIYGNVISFNTIWVDAYVKTSAVTAVESSSCTFNGSVINEGNPPYSERGFCYATHSNPTTADHKFTVSGTGVGDFSLNVSGLDYRLKYYARAYLVQNDEIIYGNTIEFSLNHQDPIVSTDSPTDVKYTTAVLNATVSYAGKPAYEKRGFYWGDSDVITETNSSVVIVPGRGEGAYCYQLQGLEADKTYYYRSFVLLPDESTPVMGSVVSFHTNEVINVVTATITDLICSGADEQNLSWKGTLYGGISLKDDHKYSEFGFVYGTSNNPVINEGDAVYLTTIHSETGDNVRLFSLDVTGFETGVHYYFRAVAKTPIDYVYGEPVDFIPILERPQVRTGYSQCEKVDGSWRCALVGAGTQGNHTGTTFGFVYGLSSNPRIDDGTSISVGFSKIEKKTDYYVFAYGATNLLANQTYYFRAYAKNDLGYVYGECLTFTTQ